MTYILVLIPQSFYIIKNYILVLFSILELEGRVKDLFTTQYNQILDKQLKNI